MKKFIIFTSAIFVLAASCAKKGMDPCPVDDFTDAPWAIDESKAVPILLSSGDGFSVRTKAPVNSLDGVQFGVLALDADKADKWAPEHESVALYNKVAKKGSDGYAQFIKPNGAPITYYYPLVTLDENNYSFYGYRTSNDLVQNNSSAFDGYFDAGTFKVDVAIDSVDVLWAKSTAPVLTKEGESASYNGFNTKYVRQSRIWYPGSWLTDYTPKFQFAHLTAALHFLITAEDDYAAATFIENGVKLVTVSNLRVDGVYKQATLDVLSGALTSVGSKGETVIVADPTVPTASGNECGTGLFILPMTTAELASEPLKINFDLSFPNPGIDTPKTYTPENYLTLTPPAGGFVAGKSYTYRIIVKSLEKVRIQLELIDWIEEPFSGDEDIITTLG